MNDKNRFDLEKTLNSLPNAVNHAIENETKVLGHTYINEKMLLIIKAKGFSDVHVYYVEEAKEKYLDEVLIYMEQTVIKRNLLKAKINN